jgi:hypothetical protein
MFYFNSVTMENLPAGTRYQFKCGEMEVQVWFPHQITLSDLKELGANTLIALYETNVVSPILLSGVTAPKTENALRFGIFTLNPAALKNCNDRNSFGDIVDRVNTVIDQHFHRISTVANLLKIDSYSVPDLGYMLTINLIDSDTQRTYDLFTAYCTKELTVIVPSMLSKRKYDIGLIDSLLVLNPVIQSNLSEYNLVDLNQLKAVGVLYTQRLGDYEFYIPNPRDIPANEIERLLGEFLVSIKPAFKYFKASD